MEKEEDLIICSTKNDGILPDAFIDKYHIHIIVNKGQASFYVGDSSFTMKKDDLVIWQMGAFIHDVSYSEDFEAEYLLVSRQFLLENNPETIWATRAFVFLKQNPVYHLRPKDKELLTSDFNRLNERISLHEHIFYHETIGQSLQTFILDLWQVYSGEISKMEGYSNFKTSLFNRFMDLVRQYSYKHHQVNWFADQLCVTPKYLSDVCRSESGYTALYWINTGITHELVRLLDKPLLTISEISVMLNFSSIAHLSKYAKKHLGMTPTEYRIIEEKQ